MKGKFEIYTEQMHNIIRMSKIRNWLVLIEFSTFQLYNKVLLWASSSFRSEIFTPKEVIALTYPNLNMT